MSMMILKDAIERKRLVQFHYDGHVRKVEPYAVGRLTSDNVALRAWHLEGFTESHRVPE
jgi:predicted DNA-binding transcriptional regulator YafY